MDALITNFLAETRAILPVPNPDFDPAKYRPEDEGKGKIRENDKPYRTPKSAPAAAAPEKVDAALQGWRSRACTPTVKDGIVTITATGDAPFLGFAPGPLDAGATLKFRIKSNGGTGKVAWLPSPATPGTEAPQSGPRSAPAFA